MGNNPSGRRRFTDAERRARLGRRHGLAGPKHRFADPVAAAEALVGLHATDPATVFLAARARVRRFSVAAMEVALYDTQTLIKHLCMRRTLFVLPQTMLHLVQAAVSDELLIAQRRALAKDVVAGGLTDDGQRWLRVVEAAAIAGLDRLGPSTGAQLSRAVPELQAKLTYAPGKAYGGDIGVATRVFTVLALAGKIRRGRPKGWTSSQHTWEPIIGPTGAEISATDARAELVRRWLASFGPATVADVAWWSGLGVTVVRRALSALDVADVELEDGEPAVCLADDLAPVRPATWVAALPALDPTAMGWIDRAWYFPPEFKPLLFDRTGNIGPTVWADGRIVGGWAQRPSGEVVTRLLTDIGVESVAAIGAEAARLQEWIGPARVIPKFRVPLDRELAGR
jgi:hypothetical protein